ncbi:MAG: hypothetical protein VXA34_00915 [Gammaproteobacteria bacterium]
MPKHANVHVTLTLAPAGTHAEPQAHNARAVQQLPKAQRKAVKRQVSTEIKAMIKAGNLTQASQLAGSMGWPADLSNYGITADDWAADTQGATQESEAPQAAPQESAPKKAGKNPRKARYAAGSDEAKEAMAKVRSHIGKPAPKHTAPAPSKTAWEPSDAVGKVIFAEMVERGVKPSVARWVLEGTPKRAARTVASNLAHLEAAIDAPEFGNASVFTVAAINEVLHTA